MAKSTVFRLCVVILLLGCWVAAFPAQAQTDLACDRTASEHRDLGNTYYNGGDYRSAIADYTCALQKDPNDAASLALRGSAYGWLGEYENALVDLDAAIEQNRFDWGVYNRRGIVYELMGDPDSALTDYTRAIDLNGSSPYIPYYNRGNIYYDRKEYDLALADYNASLADNPEYPRSYNNRANVYLAQGDYEQAISDYNLSIQYRNDNLEIPYFNLGLAYHEQGDYDQSLTNLNQALGYNAAYDRAYLLRGSIYQTLENDAAYADFATYISLVQTHTVEKTQAEIAAGGTLTMEEGLVYQVTFTAQAGQIVSASAQVIGNAELDPLMVILDSAGNALAGDDDSGLNLDAVIRQFIPSVTDTYTLLVGHADGGSSGPFNLTLQIGGEPLAEASIYPLYVGNRASVFTTGGDRLNLRSGPGLSFDVVSKLDKGTIVTLLEGPHKADGYAWWRIQTADGTVGWSVERVETEQTLQPALEIGEPALVHTPDDTLNLRSGPGVAFDIVTELPDGTRVTVLEGPQPGGDFIWWKIRTDQDVEGWVVERADNERTLIGVPQRQNGG